MPPRSRAQTRQVSDCLKLLLKGTQKVILCPARTTDGWRVPAGLRSAVAEDRLEIRSKFKDERRVTVRTAELRNEYVAELADHVLVVYASPAGKLESLAHRLLAAGKIVLTFDSPYNANLLARCARPIETLEFADLQRDGAAGGTASSRQGMISSQD